LLIVTPTLKAAQAAAAEVGTRAGSAAWLAYQHGWRWDDTGSWTRRSTEPVPDAAVRRGDLVLVDEAGMLDQDTARAVLAIADETGARIALLGDRCQLPAVGRGGVFDLAYRWVDPSARVDLDAVHRFVRTVHGTSVPDAGYAALSLAMRASEDPGAVFDALHARGQIALYGSDTERRDALAGRVAAARLSGLTPAVVVDTRDHAAAFNAAVRDRLVAAGAVDDHRAAVTADGQRIGAGDVIVTRRNDPTLGVANRETWTVTRVRRDGRLTVNDRDRGGRDLPAGYVRDHLQLGYATTGYGAQGDTTETAHLVMTEKTTAAAAYVAMTRGRLVNTAHLVAEHLDDAREQWITAFSRDRADLGPTAARDAAARAAAGYTPSPRPDDPARLADVLDQLGQAWSEQLVAHRQLQHLRQRLGHVQQQAAWSVHCQQVLGPLEADRDDARVVAEQAEHRAAGCAATLTARAEQYAARLRHAWDAQLPGADQAARTLATGPGPLRVHRGRVRDAQRHLDTWANRWAPAFPGSDLDMPTLRRWPIGYPSNVPPIAEALDQHAHRLAAAEHPDQAARLNTARQAIERYDATATAYQQARRQLEQASHQPIYDTSAAELIPELTDEVAAAQHRVVSTDQRVATLSIDPAISRQPDPDTLLDAARAAWHADRVADYQQRAFGRTDPTRSISHQPYRTPQIEHGPSISR
jgi:exodeoxyribonuclease V alpha subunit